MVTPEGLIFLRIAITTDVQLLENIRIKNYIVTRKQTHSKEQDKIYQLML